ncbi:MAG: hypothetical protein IPN96_02265 [Anaerolineales bacterium]|nr:hypothetical protein [Anaerolineales bacterium]MBK8824020.1 hypothetical protein [Anaerolineales bacterium]
MTDKKPSYQQATQYTAKDLRTVARTISVQQLSRLSLPEVDAVVELISKVVPAGNVPGMILSGLARLPGRRIPVQKMQQDVNALFSGVEQILDQAMYGAIFAGPAAIIWGYQNLLKLAGKDPDAAFPEGAWQFYAGYALREDTARHTNETHGFDTLLNEHNIHLSAVDRLTAWFMASVMCLHQYNDLLRNEWTERVSISTLEEADIKRAKKLFREWETKRPFRREEDAGDKDYPAYRQFKFEQFLLDSLKSMPASTHEAWTSKLRSAKQQDLGAYQQQMSILAYLDPGQYGETRVPFRLQDAQIGIIYRDSYYLLPICEQGSNKPIDIMNARAQISAMLGSPFSSPSQIASLTRVKRSALPGLRNKLNPMLVNDMDNLRFAPIIISADVRTRSLPLSELRQAERGIGSHALTIFDTGETFVFDQSHIFFDGAWGIALSEIMTNEALSWARYLNMLPSPAPAQTRIYTSLTLQLQPADINLVQQAPRISPEAGAETDKVNLKACLALRKQFKQRNDLIQLTINDLLVLYRAIHAATYKPSRKLLAEIDILAATQPEIALSLRQLVEEASRTNPAILIPMDASLKVPRERIYPLNMEVPLMELNLLGLHGQTMKMLDAYEASTEDRPAMYSGFDHLQKLYLASLAGFGAFLTRAKEIATQGQSASTGAIKLLAHLPLPLQRLLDKIPEQFEVLNNILKGREVFSNVGAVVSTSTLTRFMTAKDDNTQKQLAWGVMTDSRSVMRIHLRDFRPQVATLLSIGRKDLANMVTQDYLDAYADGLNVYIHDLSRITLASRETTPLSRTRKQNQNKI